MTLSLKFAALLAIFSAARLLFFFCNCKFFSGESAINILKAFAVGVRFDAITVAIFNAPVWAFWSLPFGLRARKVPNILAEMWFIALNFAALLANVVDAKYFSFTCRRMGGEVLAQPELLSESASVYFDMLVRYWYVALAGVILAYALCAIPRKLSLIGKPRPMKKSDFFCFFISIALLVICIRGGLQRKPLKSTDVNIYAPTPGTVSIANNSACNIFFTVKCANFPRGKYFAEDDPRLAMFSTKHRSVARDSLAKFRGKNVFIIILESFSAEHIGALDRQFKEFPNVTFTPFLDSLVDRGYAFDGFANGSTSVDALISVLLGIPPLSNFPYIVSQYVENAIDPLPLLLAKDGYGTMFFYGGKRNSCHFNSVRSKARIAEYYCEDDYDGPSSDVSGWGVYDEEFFQFVARKVNAAKQPFLSVLFTLSSHHPFLYPTRLHGKFPKESGSEPLRELIAYTDYSLRKFFEAAEKMDWYKNTIFLLVADHTSTPQQSYYKNTLGAYSIPIVFFDPSGELVGKSEKIAQQIDIMPTVLDLVGSEHNYFSFGSSLFDESAPRFAIGHRDGIYQLIGDDYVCRFDGENVVGLFKRSDFLLEKNLANDAAHAEKVERMEEFMEAFLQHYCESIKNNDMRAGE
ncbi:MAG: sulfatase-like hydrolase/transferase [Puniceicoccales bacterium]|nr:sulfatase-like hydrolase/transferase [Puniceicoccales bacterium]